MADQDAFRQFQIGSQRRDIPAVMLDRALVRPAGRFPVPAQVAGDDFVRLLEMVELRAPVLVRAREPVDENEGGRAAAGADEMHWCDRSQ